MLPSLFLKFVGICLFVFGFYDTTVYWYTLRKGPRTFDFFGRVMPASHIFFKVGFGVVLTFYYVVGATLVILG